ncbi:hypothetical protein P153DRAFT_349644 [Dothidotthia symphoricarpi CBS 119687]|uniref:Phenol 2-monooxygenase n=1 Tax=Dothidotthia symphoricarpi CBS 119687 TaxID=1392245 RepID=A0A6A6A130_9PLEO|nr:uncharacterized protein P153DRAFT_349644 [Dothidotthia symphoricarpi CBS 119687]KAF2125226.1 hypothetical protein P153DRAFT_349644 [Dothidotthia symphoricarpi CBS 119687]
MTDTEVSESKCDVLIVGAGPAGLMMAAWMARCGINARIVDKRGTKIFSGQADGLQCRSLEIFDSFGFADRAWKEANHMIEMCMWNPDEKGVITRSDRLPDTPVGLSRFQQIVLHQGRIERFFLDHIKKHSKDGIRVERAVLPESLHIDEAACDDHSPDNYPITVKLRHLTEDEAMPAQSKGSGVGDGLFRSNLAEDDTEELISKSREKEGSTETVRAKYMVGCDGAHSWTRGQLGFQLEGEPTDYIWGVLDVIPITDFPDIRHRCAIHSATNGSLMVIPRENKLVRLYIQLNEIKPDASGRADRSQITPAVILAAAQKILAPYTLSYKICHWWTAYQIGQRVGTNFDFKNRVFLAGDAVHTHSPKAGQGMNVSMQDSYNLGWKIGLVVRGVVKPEVLSTYGAERRQIALDLIAFDHKFSRLFSGRPAKDVMDEEGVSMEKFKQAFLAGNLFASGLSVDYAPSLLIAKPQPDTENNNTANNQHLAPHIPLGMRFPNAQILNQSSARPLPLQSLLKSDSRFHIVLFAGTPTAPAQAERLSTFCALLTSSKTLAPHLHTHIRILTVHAAPRVDVDLLRDFPDVLHPFSEETGWDYDAVFVDERSFHEGGGTAYEGFGVDRERGCVVVVRPDGYVAFIGGVGEEGGRGVERFFGGVFVA